MLRKFAFNALANLTTGVSGMAYQIALTAIATRSFGKEGFAVWALALSMAAWVSLFSANLSTVVTRRLVEAPAKTGAILHASKELARFLSAAALLVILLLSAGLAITSELLEDTEIVSFLMLVGLLALVQIWQILLQPRFGQCFANERNWLVARTVILLRVGALVGIGLFWLIKGYRQDVAALSLLVGTVVGIVIGIGAQRGKVEGSTSTDEVNVELKQMRPLLAAFAVWSIGSAMIMNGLPAYMSLIAPDRFNAFFIAYTLNMIVLSAIGTAAGALLAPVARLDVNCRSAQLRNWCAIAPAATGFILLVLMLSIWHVLPWLLPVWSAGVVSVQDVRHHLFWLSLQTMLRSMCLVYSVVLSSAAIPAQLRRPIFVEIGITTALGLPLGWWLGDTAFLCALATAGLLTSIYTSWTTLQLDHFNQRDRRWLLTLFVVSQPVILLLWIAGAR